MILIQNLMAAAVNRFPKFGYSVSIPALLNSCSASVQDPGTTGSMLFRGPLPRLDPPRLRLAEGQGSLGEAEELPF